ncbi:MAG TPA: AMP-binding protein, partial [Thermoanaerobaculia bacterium]|nr:AMP-binding protein [Thermoanaerobaculia bacterium]
MKSLNRQDATLIEVLRRRAAEMPDRPAYAFLADGEVEAERLTWAELEARVRTVAAALSAEVPRGERALLLYPPGLEFVAAFLGCLAAGIIAVPAYPPRPRRDQPRLRSILADATPRIALTTAELAGGLPEMARISRLATDTLPVAPDWDGPLPDPESPAFLQYTSGSTSLPKGVTITHANLVHNSGMIQRAFRQDAESVVVGWLPLYHDMGLIGNVLQPLWCGGRCVLMSPVAFLQRPRRWLEAIGRYRATTSGGPNFAYQLCAQKIGPAEREGLDLSSWQVAFNGAEPVRAEALERFAAAFGPQGFRREAFYPCYGLAEATLFVSGATLGEPVRVEAVDAAALERHEAVPAGEETARRLVSCGRAWDGQRIAIVDPESGAELPPGRVGEVWVAGPSVAAGYWGRPEVTERDFQARLDLGDGPFLRTGDLGFLKDGELFVTGRLKDLIILRGRNHYPQDLERTAEAGHAELRPGGAAAFAVEVNGEERLVVAAEVERRWRAELEELAAAVRRTVAEEHEVQVYEVVLLKPGGLPKTSSGKVQRHACRAGYLDGTLEALGTSAVGHGGRRDEVPAKRPAPPREELAALPEAERREAVLAWLGDRVANLAGLGTRPAPDQPLTELGLDSLSAVELKGEVEAAFGGTLPLAELLGGWGTGEVAERVLTPRPPLPSPSHTPAGRGGEEGEYPLSIGQEALWFLERLAPTGGAYNIAVAARVAGELDGEALHRALLRLVERHPALRTTFQALEDGAPVQRVGPAAVDFAVAESEERWVQEAWRPFDLENGPLLRVRLLAGGLILFAVHHLVADFWSLAVASRELGALYREETGGAPADLPSLEGDYSGFVQRQREMLAGPREEELWSFWRETLAGPPPDLDLPTDHPRPTVPSFRGGARALVLPPELAERARSLARQSGATLFATLLAVWQTLLGRWTGQEDFAVGSPTVGRPDPALAGLVGYFVNPIPLRAELAGDPPFAAHLER